jgi:hypothetical protein
VIVYSLDGFLLKLSSLPRLFYAARGDANSRWEHNAAQSAFVSFHGESAVIQLITGWYIGFLEDEKERRQSNCGRCFVTNLQFQPQAALRWLCAIVMQTFWLGEFITDMHIL